MRYIKQDVIVDAFRIVSVGPHKVKHTASVNLNVKQGDLTHCVGGVATTECTLENGDVVELHAGNTGFSLPQVGDYYLVSGSYMAKAIFEGLYTREFYGDVPEVA
jgi:hypothetical protein